VSFAPTHFWLLVNSDLGLGIYLSSVFSNKKLTMQKSTISVMTMPIKPPSTNVITVSIEFLRVKVKECQHRQH
jgi:hypothetical protein